ncbi:MAG: hypothetical protein ORO03_01390, partial [Alphaproteobacteria bacterium]|nr:hypothetical protein [Alphaproteobacteria bacterium]
TLGVLVLAMPETLPPSQRHPHTVQNIAKSFKQILSNRLYLGYAGSATAVMSAFFVYLGSAPAVFMQYYEISLQHFGLFFGTIVSGFILGSFLNSRLVRRFGSDPMLQFGLYSALVAALVVNLAAWTGWGGVYFFTFGMAVFTASASLIGGNAMAGGLSQFPKVAGLASGLMGIMQFTAGGIGVWFAGLAFGYDPTARPLALIMLIVIVIGILLHRSLVQGRGATR